MRKNKKTPNPRHSAAAALTAALVLAAAIVLTTCDSPTAAGAGGPASEAGGIGSITIGLNTGSASNRGARTAVPDSAELAGITFKVHLTGPGGTIDRDFGPDGGTIDLASGAWNITVKAYNSEPRLRGIADQTITVTPGGSQTIALTSAIGVKTEAELRDVLDVYVGRYRYNDTDLSRENLIVLEADVDLNDSLIISDSVLANPRKYTIIAEPGTTRAIYRRIGSGNGAFISMDSGSLTLGRAGETGSLVIDGMGVAYTPGSAFLYIYGNASLIIDGSTEITRMNDNSVGGTIWCDSYVEMRGGKITNCMNINGGGAITVRDPGRFVMSGGEISGNTSLTYGGGVSVEGTTTVFTMSGGLISGNISYMPGGGVAVWDTAAFTMSNGEISGNTAQGVSGGGVSVEDNATFTMSNGLISGNNATGGTGGGVYVMENATFRMDNGLISSNTAQGGGGGVSLESTLAGATSWFYMNGGEISGNIASSFHGGGVLLSGASVSNNTTAHFVLSNGEISGNTAPTGGGGVALYHKAIFEMSNGRISGNSAGKGGGLYHLDSSGTTGRYSTMSGGEITGNTATGSTGGGGVYLDIVSGSPDTSSFIMAGGTVSGIASGTVSGVYAGANTLFAKRGGTINSTGSLPIVYVDNGTPTVRNATALPTVRLYYDGQATGTETTDTDGPTNTASNWY